MEATIDMDECLTLARELARVGVSQPLWMREPPRDLPIAIDLAEVGGRRHEREVHRASLAGLAGLDELDVLAGGCQLLEIFDRLVVGRELVVGAGAEAEDRLGCRHAAVAEKGGWSV